MRVSRTDVTIENIPENHLSLRGRALHEQGDPSQKPVGGLNMVGRSVTQLIKVYCDHL